jgi:hypothetical protein
MEVEVEQATTPLFSAPLSLKSAFCFL